MQGSRLIMDDDDLVGTISEIREDLERQETGVSKLQLKTIRTRRVEMQIFVNRTTQLGVTVDEVAKSLAECDLVEEPHHQPRFFNSFFQDLEELSKRPNAVGMPVRLTFIEQGLEAYAIHAMRSIVKRWDDRMGGS